MKRWVTEIWAIDQNDPNKRMVKWAGPDVPGETEKEAIQYCQDNGLGYCKVVGLLICEIPWSMAEHAKLMYSNRDN